MIRLEETTAFGWESAIRGMRNPMNSWDKSDSFRTVDLEDVPNQKFVIGENDLKLMKKLSKAGSDHAKFLRMINVTVDITAPRYWWIEFDTYKIGTVANSCSTMHKIADKEFTLDDFSHEQLLGYWDADVLEHIVDALNDAREQYLESKDKEYWWQMIQLLPQSYNQKRTVQMNYQVLKNMYFARINHKLDEWRTFCKWCESLPYFKEVVIDA